MSENVALQSVRHSLACSLVLLFREGSCLAEHVEHAQIRLWLDQTL